jgi:hypothetical protein
MATSGRGTGMVGYNVQTAVDTEHHLIVAHEVTNVGHDRANGFTTLKTAEGEETWVQGANLLDESGGLNVRLFPSWFYRAHNGAETPDGTRALAARWKDFLSARVYPRYVKTYADGGPDSLTSVLDDDYEGRPGFKGEPYDTTENWASELGAFSEQGLGLIVHSFGDGTARQLVDVFETIRDQVGDNDTPLHFSHSNMAKPETIKRLAQIPGVCIDFMPLQYPHPSIQGSFGVAIGEWHTCLAQDSVRNDFFIFKISDIHKTVGSFSVSFKQSSESLNLTSRSSKMSATMTLPLDLCQHIRLNS